MKVRVFNFVPELDAFIVTEEFSKVADRLGLTEWNPVVWIGRLFMLDNDYGEHWFDNWDEREQRQEEAAARGIDAHDLMIIVPDRMTNGVDGPCNPPELRKAFWTSVLKSLELDYDVIFERARLENENTKQWRPEDCIQDLEERIDQLRAEVAS